MSFHNYELIRLTEKYGRYCIHIAAVLRHISSQCLSSPARVWTYGSVHQANSLPAPRNKQPPGCETSQGDTQRTNYHSPTNIQTETKLQHVYQCITGDVGHMRSVTSIINPSHIQQAGPCDRCLESHHSLLHHCVVCSGHFLGLASNFVPFSRIVLGLPTKSSVRFSHSTRCYRSHSRSKAVQNNSKVSQHLEEGASNIVDETDIDSDSDTDMSYKLPAVRQDGSQAGDDTDLDAGQETGEITANQEERYLAFPRKPANEMTLPELSQKSLNIVPYVNRSVTLQNLVRLGVNLDRIQKVSGVAEYVIKVDFNRNVVPLLKFLALVGVEASMVGHVFTVNPLLFMESVEDLELRVGYLVHKNFGLRDVASMVTRAPVVLLMDPVMLDEKLAFIQSLFNLTAHQVREVVKTCPKLLPVKNKLLSDTKFHMREFMGFSVTELQQIVLKSPRAFFCDKETLVKRFDYLHNHMMISHQQLLTWPLILCTRLHTVKNRHLFLLHKHRAQYDPYKENYVSLQSLGTHSDEEFCRTVAKCDVQEFYNFCKTL